MPRPKNSSNEQRVLHLFGRLTLLLVMVYVTLSASLHLGKTLTALEALMIGKFQTATSEITLYNGQGPMVSDLTSRVNRIEEVLSKPWNIRS